MTIKTSLMLPDEKKITKKFKDFLKTDSSHFYRQGTKVENVKCIKVDLLDLFPRESVNGVFSYRVEGRGAFCEKLEFGERETSMNIESTINVVGDDIVDIDKIRITLK